MDPVPSHRGHNNNHLNNKQKFSDRNSLPVPGQQMRQKTNKGNKGHSLEASNPGAGYMMRIQGEDAQWIENSDEVRRAGNYIAWGSKLFSIEGGEIRILQLQQSWWRHYPGEILCRQKWVPCPWDEGNPGNSPVWLINVILTLLVYQIGGGENTKQQQADLTWVLYYTVLAPTGAQEMLIIFLLFIGVCKCSSNNLRTVFNHSLKSFKSLKSSKSGSWSLKHFVLFGLWSCDEWKMFFINATFLQNFVKVTPRSYLTTLWQNDIFDKSREANFIATCSVGKGKGNHIS